MTNNKINIIVRTDMDDGHGDIMLYLNDELIGEGYVGGEPEDNTMHRDYAWIPTMLSGLAKKLGADTKVEYVDVM